MKESFPLARFKVLLDTDRRRTGTLIKAAIMVAVFQALPDAEKGCSLGRRTDSEVASSRSNDKDTTSIDKGRGRIAFDSPSCLAVVQRRAHCTFVVSHSNRHSQGTTTGI